MGWTPVLSWGLLTFQNTREFSFFKSLLRTYPMAIHQPPVTSEDIVRGLPEEDTIVLFVVHFHALGHHIVCEL